MSAKTGFNPEIKEIMTLYNIAVAVGSSLKLDEVIWILYKESGRLIDTTNFAIILYDYEIDLLNFALVFDQGRPLKSFSIKHFNNQGVIAYTLAHQTPLLVQDFLEVSDMATIDQIHAEKQVRSWLGAPILNPLLNQEGVQGVIATWSYRPNRFTEHELWLLSAIGTQAAIAIRNARLYELSQRRAAEMTYLKDVAQQWAAEMVLVNDFTRTLSGTLQFDEVVTRITERVEGILNVEVGWLLLADPQTGDFVFQTALGDATRTKAARSFRLPRGEGLAGQVARTGNPLLIDDADRNQPYIQALEQMFNVYIRNMLCIPLILHDQVIGVLEMINKKEGDFTQIDLELLNSIAPYAAIAIENARLHDNILTERDRVIEAEEQARKGLARDLHDGPTQLVSAMLMRLDFCKLLLEKEPARLSDEIATTQELARQAIHQIRTLLFELRPLVLETQGLVPALQIFLERRQKDVEQTTKLRLTIKNINSNQEISRQDEKVETAVFAIAQEAVNNAIKHAQASRIVVELEETSAAIRIIITDNGQGFEVQEVMSNYEERGSLGMLNIRERADLVGGELKLESTPGQGTYISVSVPKAREERRKKRGSTGPLSLPPNAIPKG